LYPDSSALLFRDESGAIRLLNAYMKRLGDGFLRYSIRPLLQNLLGYPYPLEIDSQRMEDPTKAAENVDKLIRISQLFVDHVCNSVHECPMYVPPSSLSAFTLIHLYLYLYVI
jgi:hypothetical protein